MAALAELSALQSDALAELASAQGEAALKLWYNAHFGDAGKVKAALKAISGVPNAERPAYGKEANTVKVALESAYETALAQAQDQALLATLSAPPLDVTLPGRPIKRGRVHPANRILRDVVTVFRNMGFDVLRTREVETEEFNFELLNMPPHHPARDMWDTFFTTTPGVVLRTHTSPGQIHAMRAAAPGPVRVILPGMCYRNEAVSTRSEIQFLQVEGLVVGPDVTMADLKGTLTAFARRLFGPERQVRIRSSYFPFTEPSIEVDIDWPADDPNRDRLTKGTGWLEILGAGMVHPRVLTAGGYDPAAVTGFAFGMGPQRMLMLQRAIDDIRLFWQNDARFLAQF